MFLIKAAFKLDGVIFSGEPKYIHHNAFLDASGGLSLGRNIVISTDAIILTHDYSYTAGLASIGKQPKTDIAVLSPVTIGDNCFIGARVTILPGTKIGSNVIVSAGTVVKGTIKSNSIIAGNPAFKVWNTKSWAEFMEQHVGSKSIHIDTN
jgi:acetyltransferase-like isoleucine patch superfamily enzyme